MAFGLNTRQDTLGNAMPEVDPPALRVTPRDRVTQRKAESTGFEEGFESLGSGLGKAFQQFMDERNKSTAETKLQETAARQQLGKTVNKEDAKLERTGWGLQFYGQNPQYALAQTMAAEQNTKHVALDINSRIDEYADLHPDEFRDKFLKRTLENIVSGYEEDPETRRKLTTTWLGKVDNLVDNHYKAWFANSQKQIFERAKSGLLVEGDGWLQSINNALDTGDPELLSKTYTEAKDFLTNYGDSIGQHPKAWRRTKLETAQASLAAGNKNIYDLLKQTGELDKLSEGEQRGINTALSAYDTKFRASVDGVYQDFREQMLYTDDIEEGEANIRSFLGELEAAEKRATGSEHSILTIQRGEANAAMWAKRLKKQLDKERKDVAKRNEEADQFEGLVLSFQNPSLESWSFQNQATYDGNVRKPLHTETVRQQALDESIKREMKDGGLDVSDESLLGAQLIRNPDIAEAIGRRLAKTPTKSALMAGMIGSFANGWQNMFDQNGKISPDGAMMIQTVERLRATGAIENYMSTQEAKDLEFIMHRVTRGQPASSIEKDFANWKQTRGNIVSGAPKDKNQTQYEADLEHVNGIAKNIYGEDLDTSSRVQVRDMYREGLGMYDNDHKKATDYVRTRLEKDAALVNGQLVPGSSKVNSFPVTTKDRHGRNKTDTVSLEDVLNGAGHRLAPYLAAAKGLDIGDYQSKYGDKRFEDQSVRISTQFGHDGIVLDFVDGTQSMPVPKYVLQSIAEELYTHQQLANEIKAREKLDMNQQWNFVGSGGATY